MAVTVSPQGGDSCHGLSLAFIHFFLELLEGVWGGPASQMGSRAQKSEHAHSVDGTTAWALSSQPIVPTLPGVWIPDAECTAVH